MYLEEGIVGGSRWECPYQQSLEQCLGEVYEGETIHPDATILVEWYTLSLVILSSLGCKS